MRILKNIIFWAIVLGLLALNLWAYARWIWFPNLEMIEFTNLDVIRVLNAIPFVHIATPATFTHFGRFCSFRRVLR